MRLRAWRPIVGCSFASTGCANCTALRAAAPALTRTARGGRMWTGRTERVASALEIPAAEPEPTAWFVCEHGDLFHPATPDGWIDEVFAAMEAAPWHSFQVLTKRAERMRDYLGARYSTRPAPAHLAFGVSAERQKELEKRAPHLQAAPAAVRYILLYPLLGPVDVGPYLKGVHMVQAGDEPQRPARDSWFEAVAAQCLAAGVPFVRAGLLAA